MASGALCHLDFSRRTAYGCDERIEVSGAEGRVESRHPIPVDVALYRGGLIRRQGYERGRVEGRAEARYGMVRRMLLKRGIEVSDGFPDGLPAECDDDSLIAAALACESEVDFLNRLRDGSPRS